MKEWNERVSEIIEAEVRRRLRKEAQGGLIRLVERKSGVFLRFDVDDGNDVKCEQTLESVLVDAIESVHDFYGRDELKSVLTRAVKVIDDVEAEADAAAAEVQ